MYYQSYGIHSKALSRSPRPEAIQKSNQETVGLTDVVEVFDACPFFQMAFDNDTDFKILLWLLASVENILCASERILPVPNYDGQLTTRSVL